VTLFPVLLIVDALIMKRKTSWRDKIPFLLVAMGAGAANAIAKAQVMHYDGVPHSPAVAALTAAELFGHVLIPARLRPVYFITPGYAPFGFSGPEAAACLIGATALAFLFRKKYPAALAAWLCALAVIAPVVSLSRPGPVFVHDRYAYLLLAVLALAFGGLMKRRAHLKQAAAILVVLLAAGSINRIQVWHDPETLWKSVVATDPQESLSYFNLGDYLLRQGKPYQAIYYLREQARRNPEKGRMNLAHAWNDLGAAYAELGRWEQAERSFTNALVFAPGERQIRANLLAARARLRKKA
jgi:hypothetical protein